MSVWLCFSSIEPLKVLIHINNSIYDIMHNCTLSIDKIWIHDHSWLFMRGNVTISVIPGQDDIFPKYILEFFSSHHFEIIQRFLSWARQDLTPSARVYWTHYHTVNLLIIYNNIYYVFMNIHDKWIKVISYVRHSKLGKKLSG